jgi:hypothetical protein
MIANRAFEPAGSPGPLPEVDPLTRQKDALVDEGGAEGPKVHHGESGATGAFGALANAGGDAMRAAWRWIPPRRRARRSARFGAIPM